MFLTLKASDLAYEQKPSYVIKRGTDRLLLIFPVTQKGMWIFSADLNALYPWCHPNFELNVLTWVLKLNICCARITFSFHLNGRKNVFCWVLCLNKCIALTHGQLSKLLFWNLCAHGPLGREVSVGLYMQPIAEHYLLLNLMHIYSVAASWLALMPCSRSGLQKS